MDPGSRTHPGYSNPPSAMTQHLDSLQHAWSLSNRDWSKGSPRGGTQNLDQWGVVGQERMLSGNSSYSWSNTSDLSGMRELTGLSSSPLLNGNLENLESYAGGIDARNLSTTFPAIFSDKLRLSVSDAGVGQSLDNSASHIIGDLEGDDTFSSLQELELHTIGNLLPDDEEELLAGVTDDFDCIVSLNNAEETEDFDLFSSGGGMELEGDSQDAMGLYVSGHRGGDSMLGGAAGQQGAANAAGSVAGKHPYGEHPSRTFFVRNINSNVEDTELRTLFEQYGAIRTLYTACKHRGFVMISYYDIRAACSAMRALQNKPLRRRKLDIHFSIPKDNPSDKDVNQGTLVVFNLDASVSNDDLRHIFGGYGEVKEIRETPHKHHHKFIEFYDVRAAEAALRALNRSDIAGKRIKLEPSRPGGARRSLLQQLSQDLDPDDSQPIHQQSHSPLNSSPPGHPAIWGSVSSAVENGSLRGMHQSLPLGSFQTLGSMPLSGSISLPPHISSPIRVGTIGSHVAQSTQIEAGHSLGHLGLGHRLPPHHPQSLPEYGKGLMNSGHLISSGSNTSGSTTTALRSREGFGEGSRLQRSISGSLNDSLSSDHTSRVLGVSSTGPYLFPSSSSNGNGSLSGNQFLWGNPSPYHQQTQSSPLVSWPNTSSAQSFSHNGQIQLQSNAYSASQGTLMNTILARHHVGSAPSGEPSPIERRQSYLGELPESSSLMGSASGGSMGMIGHSGAHAINIGGSHGLMNLGPALEHSSSSPSLSVMSPQQCARVFVNGGLLGSVSGSMERLSDHGRGHRGESLTAQAENKKQYQLDLDRILRGEDPRTTLMIKNIPNKYTSKMLLAAIDENHRGTYDFIYLPIDFKNKCNVGYAFINMIAPSCIVTFYQAFNGKKWEKFNSEKVASLAYARIQGKAALVAHFQNSSLMNEDKRCHPILFHSEGPHVGDQVMKGPQAQSRGSGFVGPLGVPDKWDCQSSSQKEGFQSTYQNEASANLEPGPSQGKNKDNEIHQFSQHGEGLVSYLDQVGHFVITENGNFEEENLQKSLQHMLIGLQRHGEAAATNLHEFHAEFMGDSIFVAAREVVEGVEFLFSDAQCMSRMVGVSLERAKVLVTSGYEVEVMQLSENNWKRSWEKVFSQVKDSESSELVAIKMPKLQGDHVKSTSLPAEDISRKFGVSLKDFPETHVITLNCEEEQSGQFFPLVWKVVDEYRNLKCGSTCATTKQTSGTGSTKSPNTSSSGSIQQSTSGGGPNFSQSPSLTRQEEKMDDDEDDDKSLPPEDPLPPDPSSAPNDMRNRKLKVSIFPGAGGAFHDPDTKQPVQQTPFRQVATIMPVIEIEFLQEGIDKKFITVTTKTQCNLGTDGGPKWHGVNFFSWYQNNIKISFKGNDRQTQLLSSSASAQDDSLIETKLTINKALMASTSSSQEESRGAGGQIHIAGSGVQGQIDIKATETQGGNLTIANTQEIGGIKQIQGFIVHPRCRENDLVFNFCLPSRLMPESSTQSGMDLQSLSQCDDTFEPKVTGKWIVWSEDQHACYVFKVRRYLYRLALSDWHQDEIKCLMQDYKLLMFVNLAMTHLDRYNTNDIVRLTERNPELPYVIKVTPGG